MVEARRSMSYLDFPALADWVRESGGWATYTQDEKGPAYMLIGYPTEVRVDVGDWIVSHPGGAFWVVSPDTFAARYEAVSTEGLSLEEKARILTYWLLRAHASGHREGWQEGPSVAETMEGLFSVLVNMGLDPTLGDPSPGDLFMKDVESNHADNLFLNRSTESPQGEG